MSSIKSIPPFKLIPEPLNDEAAHLPKFKWAPKEIGTRHQLGGKPTFIQDEQSPQCACCQKLMLFYAQLDSINDDFVIADCGMIYVFICFDCDEVATIVQSF